jgi:hypothetical protein
MIGGRLAVTLVIEKEVHGRFPGIGADGAEAFGLG